MQRVHQKYINVLLLVCGIVSLVLVLIGGAIYLFQYGHQIAILSYPSAALSHPSDALRIVTMGFYALVLSQVARVVAAFWIFSKEKDFPNASVAMFIFVVLLFSLLR